MDMLLILDFGARQSLSVARRIRAENIYCEILPCDADFARIAGKTPKGLVLVGGAQDGEKDCDARVYEMGVPMLCLGGGARAAVRHFGGEIVGTALENRPSHIEFAQSELFEQLSECDRMLERADEWKLPEGFAPIAQGNGFDAAFACAEKKIYGLQFYPEPNDPDGLQILANFAKICSCEAQWTVQSFIEKQIGSIREQVGDGHALIAISGGVDSAVCAVLMHAAIGRRMHCLHVDTGLMRKDESAKIAQVFGDIGMDLKTVNAAERFLGRLRGVTDPDEKRSMISDEFGRVFGEEAAKLGEKDYLVQGTIYTDVLDAGGEAAGMVQGTRSCAGLVEPLRKLFKDEVRRVGMALGLPEEMVQRQPFPGPGLAVRCIGEVTEEKLAILREADAIFCDEIQKAGLDKRIRQYFAVLSDMRTAKAADGTNGPAATIALRAVNVMDAATATPVRLPYDLLENCAARIMDDVPGVARVVYDISGKPPAMIEWE